MVLVLSVLVFGLFWFFQWFLMPPLLHLPPPLVLPILSLSAFLGCAQIKAPRWGRPQLWLTRFVFVGEARGGRAHTFRQAAGVKTQLWLTRFVLFGGAGGGRAHRFRHAAGVRHNCVLPILCLSAFLGGAQVQARRRGKPQLWLTRFVFVGGASGGRARRFQKCREIKAWLFVQRYHAIAVRQTVGSRMNLSKS